MKRKGWESWLFTARGVTGYGPSSGSEDTPASLASLASLARSLAG